MKEQDFSFQKKVRYLSSVLTTTSLELHKLGEPLVYCLRHVFGPLCTLLNSAGTLTIASRELADNQKPFPSSTLQRIKGN